MPTATAWEATTNSVSAWASDRVTAEREGPGICQVPLSIWERRRGILKRLTVGRAAERVGMSAETLRHYDRIGLLRPCARDGLSGYRLYSEGDLVKLKTIGMLQEMGLSLAEIGKALSLDSLEDILDFLDLAERKCDERIAQLKAGRRRIERAKSDYKTRLGMQRQGGTAVRWQEERTILLSELMHSATVVNLWDFIGSMQKEVSRLPGKWRFGGSAGLYRSHSMSGLYATLSSVGSGRDTIVLPAGDYLCSASSADRLDENIAMLEDKAMELCGKKSTLTLQEIVVTGILAWSYEIQIPLF